jgi:hypothetical protein
MTIRSTIAVAAAALLTTGLAPIAPAGAATYADQRAAEPRTRLTFTVDDCEGCRVRLVNARGSYDVLGSIRVWQSRSRLVEDGSVTFHVATKRTWGMSATVVAPWEGQTGYLTTVAWRYNGEQVGDAVTLEEAVSKKKASACWEGTRRRDVTIPLAVEEVEVLGVKEEVPGSIAFVPTTQSWLSPMREVWEGVLGSQDVNLCR